MTKTKRKGFIIASFFVAFVLTIFGTVMSFAKAEDKKITESVENAQITVLDTITASNWDFASDNAGTQVSGGKVVASNAGADGQSDCRYNQTIKTDAIQFVFRAETTQPENVKANTMWTVRAEKGNGGPFSAFTGYHIVLYPNRGQILCITNPDIAERGNTGENKIDLKGLLFDGEEHTVVVGAVDRADGVYVFMDVDGVNVWNFTDDLKDGQPRIAKAGTAFCVGHRDEGAGCEQPNYTIASPAGFDPEEKIPTISDPNNITLLSTKTAADWHSSNDGAKVSGGMLTASNLGADGESACYYKEEITTDAIQFMFRSYGTQPDNVKANTMWTVRAEKGKGGSFAAFKGYHIVLYPNRGQILCITNPDIAERGNTGENKIDLKSLLFDGEEHTVVIGAIDQDNGVYVFMDVDGVNVWGFTDDLKDGQPRIAKAGTAFCVGHRDEGTGCEQPNYYINYQEEAVPEYTSYALQAKDFNKSNWEIYQNISVADESLISNSGETHAMAKYLGTGYEGQDAVQFQLKISSVTDRIMFCLRSERDRGGEMFWNGKMIAVRINLTGYNLIFNHTGEAGDVRDAKSGSLRTRLETNRTYKIEVGSVDTEDGVSVFLYIDDVLQFIYTDTAEAAKQVTKGANPTFKIGSYDKSQFVVTAVGAEERGKDATRENTALAETKITNENWANILNAYNPDLEKEGEDTLILHNKGGVAYADCLKISQIDFDFQFDDSDEIITFMFNKNRRGTYFDQYLQQAEYQVNMCYSISLVANGGINIQKATQSAYSSVNTLKSIWEAPFGNEKHHLTVTFAVDEATNEAVIEIYLDGAKEGYKAIDPACSETYRKGYIGFQKMGYDGAFTVSDVRYTGEVIDTTEGKNTQVKNVYLAQFYEKDKHDFEAYLGKNILRWSYTKDSDYVKSVSVKVEGKTVREVVYPVNAVEIADEYKGKNADIVLNTIDGTFSTLTVKLEDVRSGYEVAEERYNDRIAIRENNVTGYAEFYYNDGITPAGQSRRFMPVGHNYLLLKDGWESTAFDASPNVLLNNYDPMEVEAMLALMAKNSYNSLRFFLGGQTSYSIGGFGGGPNAKDSDFYKIDGKKAYYIPYMDNLVDFMTRCQKYGIYNLFVLGIGCPQSEYFSQYHAGLKSINSYILEEKYIQGKEVYARTFLQYFKDYDKEHGTNLVNTIFAISNDNESAYGARAWPFNLKESVTLANGKTYDMTNKTDRQNAADEGKIFFYDRFVKAVKSVDPQFLTCEGMYTLFAVGNYNDGNPDANYGLTPLGDSNDAFPTTLDIMMKTALDFFDVHVYHTTGKELKPVFGENMRSLKYNDEVKAGQAKKPIIMAEFGAFRSKAPTWEAGQQIVVDQRDIALGEGYHFQGFITWQLNEFKQTELYAMLEGDAEFFEGALRYIYLEKAELIADEAKVVYDVDEELDVAGLKVKCYMSDGTTKDVSVDEAMLWNGDEIDMSAKGKKTVELLFEEQMILSYEIEVKEASFPVDPPDSSDDSASDSGAGSASGSGGEQSSETDVGCKGGCGSSAAGLTSMALAFAAAALIIGKKRGTGNK